MLEPAESREAMEEMVDYEVKTVQVNSSKEVKVESGQEQGFAETHTELPEHVRCLFEECLQRFTEEQARLVQELLIQFADVFATLDLDIEWFTVFAHRIKTGAAFPLRKSMKRTPLGFDQEERKTLKAMLDAKVIKPSQSEWASPPVLVRKRDGTWHYCINFRGVNTLTTRGTYPLPLIEECIDRLADMRWHSTLDMNSGYWQRPVAEEVKEKTAFITKYSLFHFLRMPFGLSNAPATFQRTMNVVLSGLMCVSVIVYLDDVNVIGKTFHENLANLRVVLSWFWKYGLKLKPRKCVLFRHEIVFFGSKSGWRWGAHHKWSCPCTSGVARTNKEEASGAVLGVCELPSGIHSGFGQDHCPSVWADGADGKMKVGRRASQGIHWVEKHHGHSTSDGMP